MTPKKNYTAPLWLLVFIISMQLVFLIVLTIWAPAQKPAGNAEHSGLSGLFPNPYTELVVTMIILAGEGIVLWHIRTMPYSKILAWGYVITLLCALVLLPLEPLLRTGTLHLSTGNILLYWILMVLGHAFFIRLLQRAYYPKQSRSADLGDLGDVIDELL